MARKARATMLGAGFLNPSALPGCYVRSFPCCWSENKTSAGQAAAPGGAPALAG